MEIKDIRCPRCNAGDCKELHRDNNNIDNLMHSDMECINCGVRFLVWHETQERLKEVFGDSFDLYAKLDMWHNR